MYGGLRRVAPLFIIVTLFSITHSALATPEYKPLARHAAYLARQNQNVTNSAPQPNGTSTSPNADLSPSPSPSPSGTSVTASTSPTSSAPTTTSASSVASGVTTSPSVSLTPEVSTSISPSPVSASVIPDSSLSNIPIPTASETVRSIVSVTNKVPPTRTLGTTATVTDNGTDSTDIPGPTNSPTGFLQNTAAVAGVFSVVGILLLAVVIGLLVPLCKRIRRRRSIAETEDEDFVIGESDSSRNGHPRTGSMRSVASSGQGPVVTDRAGSFTLIPPTTPTTPRVASYDPSNYNPFEDQHGTTASVVPPAIAMAAAHGNYPRQPQWDPRQQRHPQAAPYGAHLYAAQEQAYYDGHAYRAQAIRNNLYPSPPQTSRSAHSVEDYQDPHYHRNRGPLRVAN